MACKSSGLVPETDGVPTPRTGYVSRPTPSPDAVRSWTVVSLGGTPSSASLKLISPKNLIL